MASITFTAGTVIPSTWLNDVNAIVYGSSSPPANPIRVNLSGSVGIGANTIGASKFWIQPGANSGIGFFQDADNMGLIAGYSNTGTGLGMRVAGSAGLYLSGNGANVSQMTLSTTGNVTIGTPTSGSSLVLNQNTNGASIFFNSGNTPGTSLLVPAGNQVLYSLLGANGVAGPGIQARWDSGTINRYLAFGNYNNAGTWTEVARIGDDRSLLATADGGLGYGTGAGGTVTQATSKSTTVTLNKTCGQITMNAASLAANTTVGFSFINSSIAATDVILIQTSAGMADPSKYSVRVGSVTAGSAAVYLTNTSGGALAEAVVLNFVNIKAVAA